MPALAALRWDWAVERGESQGSLIDFEKQFTAWYAEAESSHLALVVEDGGAIVGMAWIARVARVPEPGHPAVLYVDLQSVYLSASHRNRGVGSQLIGAALEHAATLGASVVTVHAGRRSESLYRRLGFQVAPRLFTVEVDGALG